MLRVSWNTTHRLAGSCQGSGSLFIRLLGKHPEPQEDGCKARAVAWRAFCPLQHILAPLPYTSAGTALTRGKSKAAAAAPWDENTNQHFPKHSWKTLSYFYFTTVTDCRLASTHYIGEKVVPLSRIRFVLICATKMYRNALLFWALYILRVNFWRQNCFQGIPQERGDKMSNAHVCCAVGGTALPWQLPNKQLFCHSAVTRPCSPLGEGARGYRAASIHTSLSTQPQQGQQQMPQMNKCSWVLPTQPGAQHCSLTSSCQAQRCVQGHKTDKKIAKFQNPTSESVRWAKSIRKSMEKGRIAPCSRFLQLNRAKQNVGLHCQALWGVLWLQEVLSTKGQQEQQLERKMESDKRSYQQLQQLPGDTLGNLMY